MNPRIFTRMSAMPIILAIILLIFAPFTITLTSAEVTDLDVPPWVVQGDTLSISGEASADEEVWIDSSFEISLPVFEGEYYDEFIGIHFPEGEKNFSVIAENIKNIKVSLSPVEGETVTITCSGQTMTITVSGAEIEYPLEEPINKTDAVEFSVSLPKLIEISPLLDITLDIIGKKDIKISGDAADNATPVNLIVAMSIKVTADSEGDFTLDISTEGVPIGEFLITARGEDGETIKKTVRIDPSSTPTPTPSSNGGDGDDTPDTTPTPTPSPIPSPSPSPTSTPTPTLIPTPTPTFTTTPQTTPIKNETGEKSSSPTPQNKTNQSPQKTTKPFRIPGFGVEAIECIAIAALIIIIMKKKEGK